jgi:hypothetical protein
MSVFKRSRGLWLLAMVVGPGFAVLLLGQSIPRYRVDPFWPKELPSNWMLGSIDHLFLDQDDHVWVFHQPGLLQRDQAGLAQDPPLSECCVPAPTIIEFDSDGNVLKSWRGPTAAPHWPAGAGPIGIDSNKNIWMTASGRRPGIHVPRPEAKNRPYGGGDLLQFSLAGDLLLEIGRNPRDSGASNNQDTGMFGVPTGVQVDERAHEVYVADGYTNRRIVVYDSVTGAFKRGWGAYGMPLSQIENVDYEDNPEIVRPINLGQDYNPDAPPPKQFRGAMIVRLSNDGLVYVGDEENDRIQVFTTQGKFVKEFFVAPRTLDEGSVMDVALSRDPKQKFLIIADGSNNVVWVLNRNDGSVVTKFGGRGHNVGQFSYLHAVDTDSHGNIYTGEVKYNYRIQKFALEK